MNHVTLKQAAGAVFLALCLSPFLAPQAGAQDDEIKCVSAFEKRVTPISQMMHERKDPDRWKKYDVFLAEFVPCSNDEVKKKVQNMSEIALAYDWDAFIASIRKGLPPNTVMDGIEWGFDRDEGITRHLLQIKKNAARLCPLQLKKFCLTVKDTDL